MMDNKCCGSRLCVGALGVSLGIVTALVMMLFAWAGWLWGYGTTIIDQYGTVYFGYTYTLVGGLIGAVWGFVEGFILGAILAYVYNFICRRCPCKTCAGCCGKQCNTPIK